MGKWACIILAMEAKVAASDVLKNEYNALVAKLDKGEVGIDFGRLQEIILQMRKEGTPCGRVRIGLRPERQPGSTVAAAYEAAMAVYPVLPPIDWYGRKDPAGMSSQQKAQLAWQQKRPAVKGAADVAAPAVRKPRPLDEESSAALAALQVDAGKAASGNPFAEKLAALQR